MVLIALGFCLGFMYRHALIVGTCIDITQLKQAELFLAVLGKIGR